MGKVLTKSAWSKLKSESGTKDLIRDKWHIGKHLEEFHGLKSDYEARAKKLTEIIRKIGEYAGEVRRKNKQKNPALTEFANSLDKLGSKLLKELKSLELEVKSARGDLDSMQQQITTHTALRQKMAVKLAPVATEMSNLLRECNGYKNMAEKVLASAQSTEQAGDEKKNSAAIKQGEEIARRAKAALAKADKLYDTKVVKNDKLLTSRLDGPIGKFADKLDASFVRAQKAEMGKHLKAVSKQTDAINEDKDEIRSIVKEAIACTEEAEGHSLGDLNPGKFLKTLEEAEAAAAEQVTTLNLLAKQAEADESAVAALVKLEGGAAKLETRYTKQVIVRARRALTAKRDLQVLARRLNSVPKKLDGIATVDAAKKATKDTLAKAVAALNIASAKTAAVKQLYESTIKELGQVK